jgi:hypothetical protein
LLILTLLRITSTSASTTATYISTSLFGNSRNRMPCKNNLYVEDSSSARFPARPAATIDCFDLAR